MGLPTFPAAQLLVFWGGVQQGFNGFRHNPAEYARSVKCPVLMMHGEHDSRVTVEQARNIFDNLGERRGSNCSMLATRLSQWPSRRRGARR
jgi:alpha-beta hydrolase superfamily lysophospholipase